MPGFLKRQYFGQPTDNPPVPADVKLSSKIDGNIVLQSVQNTETNITTFPEGVTSASMLDSGNVVVFNSNNNTIWQSFEHPTDTFLATQHLSNSTLYSSVSESDQSTGIFRLYAVGTALLPENTLTGVPSSHGNGGNVTLRLVDDGHLHLLNSTGTYLNNLTQGGYPRKDKSLPNE